MMTEVAGEVADGVIIHAFTTEKYLREVTLPAVERGLAKAGRSRDDFQVVYPGFCEWYGRSAVQPNKTSSM